MHGSFRQSKSDTTDTLGKVWINAEAIFSICGFLRTSIGTMFKLSKVPQVVSIMWHQLFRRLELRCLVLTNEKHRQGLSDSRSRCTAATFLRDTRYQLGNLILFRIPEFLDIRIIGLSHLFPFLSLRALNSTLSFFLSSSCYSKYMSTGRAIFWSPNKIDESTFKVCWRNDYVLWTVRDNHLLTFLKALLWSSAAVALPFVPFRLLARWKVFHKLFIDDALVVFAYLLLLAYVIVWQEYTDDLYVVVRVSTGAEAPPVDIFNRIKRWSVIRMLHVFLSGFCLWSIKLAFLLFFRRLGQKVRYQKPIWWSVLIWNMVTFVVWMGIVQWQCIAISPERAVGNSNTFPRPQKLLT